MAEEIRIVLEDRESGLYTLYLDGSDIMTGTLEGITDYLATNLSGLSDLTN